MPAWTQAVKAAEGGVLLQLEVVPGSRERRFPVGFDAWRGRIEAKVRAPPEGGQANAELCDLVAEALGVARAAVRVASGHTSRRKAVRVDDVTVEQAVARLAPAMGA